VVAPSTGSVVLVPFPFSDLSQSKLRPAIVLASADRDDWVLCQVTSKPYGDTRALELRDADFVVGGLRVSSFARPAKLFTAHQSLFVAEVGKLNQRSIELSPQLRELFSRTPNRYGIVSTGGGDVGGASMLCGVERARRALWESVKKSGVGRSEVVWRDG
jgi:mRNA interferase MazF